MTNPYDDIINLPHHISQTRARMSLSDRAAQFSPFAALTGYDAAVAESARLTQPQIEPGEETIAELNENLSQIRRRLPQRVNVTITHFVADELKSGGAYVTTTGIVKKLDCRGQWLQLEDGAMIFFGNMLAIGVSD